MIEKKEPDNHHPSLLTIEKLWLRPTDVPSTGREVIYFPPIGGDENAIMPLSELGNYDSIHAVITEVYGYSDYEEYVSQVEARLKSSPDFDSSQLRIVGFSSGCRLALEVGRRLGLPPSQILLFAPVSSFVPSTQNLRAGGERRRGIRQDMKAGREHLKRVLTNFSLLSNNGQGLFAQVKNLYRATKQCLVNEQDLQHAHATVISGNRDWVSPPGDYSNIIVDAGHKLDEFLRTRKIMDLLGSESLDDALPLAG